MAPSGIAPRPRPERRSSSWTDGRPIPDRDSAASQSDQEPPRVPCQGPSLVPRRIVEDRKEMSVAEVDGHIAGHGIRGELEDATSRQRLHRACGRVDRLLEPEELAVVLPGHAGTPGSEDSPRSVDSEL